MKRQQKSGTTATGRKRNGEPRKIQLGVRSFILFIITLIFLVIGASIILDILKIRSYAPMEDSPELFIPGSTHIMLEELNTSGTYNRDLVAYITQILDARYETGDFELLSLLRIFYSHEKELSDADKILLRKSILGYKYWMVDPGKDNLYFWSESRQILFAAAEYLAGKLFPDMIFTNAQLSGSEHMARARERILIWMQQRWDSGFSEWNSAESYANILAALGCLVDFSGDAELMIKSRIITDLIIYDVATGTAGGSFSVAAANTSGAMRRDSVQSPLQPLVDKLAGTETGEIPEPGIFLNFQLSEAYQIPDIFHAIAASPDPVISRASQGLDLSEFSSTRNPSQAVIMQQFAMQAYTEPSVIQSTISYLDTHALFSNTAFYELRKINYTLLKLFGLLPAVSRLGNPDADRTLLDRANIYTYRSGEYSLSTVQSYNPGENGDRQLIWRANFGDGAVVFALHPRTGTTADAAGANTFWSQNGQLPDAVQYGQISMSIFGKSSSAPFFPDESAAVTHAYLPEEKFDEVIVSNKTLFARKNSSFLALIARFPVSYLEDDQGQRADVVQEGVGSCWIVETSNAHSESFTAFMKRIGGNLVTFEDERITYSSGGDELAFQYGGVFKRNGETVPMEYLRYDSPFVTAKRFPESIEFSAGGQSLLLNFGEQIRTLDNSE